MEAETISLSLIAVITVAVMIVAVVYWAFKPDKCPRCGETMECHYDEREGVFTYYCPKCGNVIITENEQG